MNRRSFIGSVLGTFVASGLPFEAAEAKMKMPDTILDQFKHLIRLFEIPQTQLLRCRLYFETDLGIKVYCPSTIKAERQMTDKLLIKFYGEPVTAGQAVIMKKIGLIDDLGNYVKSHEFQHGIVLVNGDQLVGDYQLFLGIL